MLKQHQLLNKSHLADKLDPSVSLSRCCHQFVKFQSSFEMWVSLPLLPSGESEWISYLPYFSGMLVAFFSHLRRSGDFAGIQTHNLSVRSPLLLPTSYPAPFFSGIMCVLVAGTSAKFLT